MKRSIFCLILLFTQGASGQSLDVRLEKALGILKLAAQEENSDGIVYASREIAEIFFHQSLMNDPDQVERLTTKFVSYLEQNEQSLSALSLLKLRQAFVLKMELIKDDPSYTKKGWVRGLVFSAIVASVIHGIDRVSGRHLLKLTRRMGIAAMRTSKKCRYRVAAIGNYIGYFQFKHPRMSHYVVLIPSVTRLSSLFYFSQYENWDASEHAAESEILSTLETLIDHKNN